MFLHRAKVRWTASAPKLAVLITTLALSATSFGATIYRWVDRNGTVVYSSEPRPGASTILVPPPHPATGPTQPGPANIVQPMPAKQADVRYTEALIVEPKDESTIHSNAGEVPVEVSVQPGLNASAGDRIAVLLDGRMLPQRYTATSFTLSGVERGAHTLQAVVVSPDGATRISTAIATFYVWHASRLFHPR
ncbi:MAG: DUF4124 domain-containing protein [Betaproteobacteria bacterium]|nr:DUF4124 domain-containing protein [Betaproteobacteria bacterium]